MKKFIIAGLAALAALGATGCELNSQTARGQANTIMNAAEAICGAPDGDANAQSAFDTHKGITNIMLMEGSTDDGVVTCNDGTNHYFDG